MRLMHGISPTMHEVEIGVVRLAFSYETLIGIHTGAAWIVSQNEWGATTGKHLNSLDGGSKEAKDRRLPQHEVEEITSDLISVQRFATIDGILAGLA